MASALGLIKNNGLLWKTLNVSWIKMRILWSRDTSSYIGEHLDLIGREVNNGQEDQVFRLMFMVSPAILLFMALAHLCIDWGGLLYYIGTHIAIHSCQ